MNEHRQFAFERSSHLSRRIVGVDYDHAFELDQRNGWLEPGELDAEQMHEVVQRASQVLHELIVFCIDGKACDTVTSTERMMARFFSFVDRYFPGMLVDKLGEKITRFDIGSSIRGYGKRGKNGDRIYAQAYYFKDRWSGLNQSMRQRALDGLREYVGFCCKVKFERHKLHEGLLRGFRRFISLAWLIRPGLLVDRHGEQMSLERLGLVLCCGKCWLSTIAEDFSTKWRYHARVQKSKTSRPNYAAATAKAWAKRRIKDDTAKHKACQSPKKPKPQPTHR